MERLSIRPLPALPVKSPISHVRNLVFQGGSVMGISYVGAYEALLQEGLTIHQIERIAGTSAGAINALLLCIGFTVPEMKKILSELDFKTFLDQDKIDLRSTLFELKDKKGPALFAKAASNSIQLSVGSSILNESFGIFAGEILRDWLESLIREKTGIKHLTFEELHQLHLKSPHLYKDLYVVGANANTNESEVFSWEKLPNGIISDAVRISMSIPIVFAPHQVYIKQYNLRQLDPKRERYLYVDGGVTNNYPLFVFDYHTYLSDDLKSKILPGVRCANPATLGFRLVPKEKKDYLTGVTKEKVAQDLLKFFPFLKAVLSTIYHKQESDHVLAQEQWRTIYIDTCGVNTLDFDLDEMQKNNLMTSAKTAVKEFYGAMKSTPVSLPNFRI